MASSWAMPLSDLGRNSDQFDDHCNHDEHGNDGDDDDDDDKNLTRRQSADEEHSESKHARQDKPTHGHRYPHCLRYQHCHCHHHHEKVIQDNNTRGPLCPTSRV